MDLSWQHHTWCQILCFSKLEDCTIEYWDDKKHAPSCEVCQNPDRVPERALELQTLFTVSIEVSYVVSEQENLSYNGTKELELLGSKK